MDVGSHLLLVDDSDAVLAFERAVLSRHYPLASAGDGVEALERMREAPPMAVLLDISMPRMDGDEVLAIMRADPGLAEIPVVIITSEEPRAQAAMGLGADAYLIKPIRADELQEVVDRVLRMRRELLRERNLTALVVQAGPHRFAMPLSKVEMVFHQPQTIPLLGGPAYMDEMIVVHGAPVCVLDVPARLGVAHDVPLLDRKLIIVRAGDERLALCLDFVEDPREFDSDRITPRNEVGGGQHGDLPTMLLAMLNVDDQQLPVVEPAAFLAPTELDALPALLALSAEAGK